MFIDNLKTVLKRPALGLEFASYKLNQMAHQGRAVRTLSDNIKIAGFSGFSEFHSCRRAVNSVERIFLSTLPKVEGAVIDIGANLGIVSVILARHFADRPVHAFEPNPSTNKALRDNLLLNGCKNTVVHELAVSDRDGDVLFDANPKNRATAKIIKGADRYAISLPCVSLDGFMRRQGLDRIAFMKIDVEGYETLVLEGANDAISKRRFAVIYFEVCPSLAIRAGFDPQQAARRLQERGYRLCRLDEHGQLMPTALSQIPGVKLENWIALRS